MNLQEMEKRLQTLEDIEEIKKVHVRYVNCLTTIKWDELVDCFAEDAVVYLQKVASGKKAIAKYYKEEASQRHVGLEGPFCVHPIISVEGDKAKGSWLLYIKWSHPHKPLPKLDFLCTEDAPDWFQGYHDMEYKKENGKWKISSLKWQCRLVSPSTSMSKSV